MDTLAGAGDCAPALKGIFPPCRCYAWGPGDWPGPTKVGWNFLFKLTELPNNFDGAIQDYISTILFIIRH